MATQLPTVEKQYLTSDGDVIDRICWDYYGTNLRVTEAVLNRNRYLCEHPVILPAGLIITLPVVSLDQVQNGVDLWKYAKVTNEAPPLTTRTLDQQAQDALAGYRATQASTVGPTTTPGSGGSGGTVVDDPAELTTAEWLAVYYQAGNKWVLGRIHKDLLIDDSLKTRVATLEDFKSKVLGLSFIPDGSATLNVAGDGSLSIDFNMQKFREGGQNLSAQQIVDMIRPHFGHHTLEVCEAPGTVQVLAFPIT